MADPTPSNQAHIARALRAVASRKAAAAARARNPETKCALERDARAALRNAKLADAGKYVPPAPPVTARTGAALAAHRTRAEQALARTRNPERRAELTARIRDLTARLRAVATDQEAAA